jgi:chromosome segregation ATPase
MSTQDDQTGNVANLTLEILRQIRDEARATNERLDQTNERLDQTNERLDQTNERLDRTNQHLASFEARVDRRFREQEEATRDGFALVAKHLRRLDQRIDNVLVGPHRDEHRDLRERVEHIEARLGPE